MDEASYDFERGFEYYNYHTGTIIYGIVTHLPQSIWKRNRYAVYTANDTTLFFGDAITALPPNWIGL
jgi:hypothetical protein